jgi:hypothetical protein
VTVASFEVPPSRSEKIHLLWSYLPEMSEAEEKSDSKGGWRMEDLPLMRLLPLVLTFTWSRWTVTSGGWEFAAVESDFHLWFTLKNGCLCVRLSDQDDENAWWDCDNRERPTPRADALVDSSVLAFGSVPQAERVQRIRRMDAKRSNCDDVDASNPAKHIHQELLGLLQ